MRFPIVPVIVFTHVLIVSASLGIIADVGCTISDCEGLLFNDMSDQCFGSTDCSALGNLGSVADSGITSSDAYEMSINDASGTSPDPDKVTIGIIAFITAIVLGVVTVLVARLFSSKKDDDQKEE